MTESLGVEREAMARVTQQLAHLDKVAALLEREMMGKLGSDDAHRIMEYARAEDDKSLRTILDRLNDMRSEFRDALKHAEREALHAKEAQESSQKLALQDMEARLTAAINRPPATGSLFIRYLPLIVALIGLLFAVISGNPNWLHFG